MRSFQYVVGVLVGLAICVFSFLATSPEALCADYEPERTSQGYLIGSFETYRAPMPFPAARCLAESPDGGLSVDYVIDWTASMLLALGIAVVAVSILAYKKQRQERAELTSR